MIPFIRQGIIGSLLILQAASLSAAELAPMADVHLHFNWDQKELLSARQAVQRLREQNVVLAVVFGTPSEMAYELREAGGDWIIPFFSPYLTPEHRYIWFQRPEVLERARAALASGRFQGIGEMHLTGGMGPRRDNPVFLGLLALAREFQVPVNLHTDSSRSEFFLPICQEYADVRFLWAHSGGILTPDEVERVLAGCPNVWPELSARDPWHYGNLTAGEDDRLDPEWKQLILRYPDRFMTGTDPVWNAHQMHRWFEADEGWLHYAQLNRYHRGWIAQLPPEVARKVLLENALNFFRRQP